MGRIAAKAVTAAAGAVICTLAVGCASPPASPMRNTVALDAEHIRFFGDFELPRKLGSIENAGLQMPAVSPDGTQVIYHRSNQEGLAQMTLLGSTDPADTPREGSLSLWIRPLAGASHGRSLSPRRWVHSAVWASSGKAVAFVSNEPPGSRIVHLELSSGSETELVSPDPINCLPRFDGDDRTLLFCGGEAARGPFRIYRQSIGDAEAVALSPKGADCFLPVLSNAMGRVVCARADGEQLRWVTASEDATTDLAGNCGVPSRPALLQTWAGIIDPVAPDRGAFAFYDPAADRTCVWHLNEQTLRRHRPRSIAACWLSGSAIALATDEFLFAVQTQTGKSPVLLNGAWVPCQYVDRERRLILLGPDRPGRLSIHEIVFRLREPRTGVEAPTS